MRKRQNNLKILLIILVLCIIIFMLVSKKEMYKDLYDDILFIRSQFSNKIQQEDTVFYSQKGQIEQYNFQIQYKNTDFHHQVNLEKTIQKETLVEEKIAPGVEGSFQIIVEANQDSIYKIHFDSKNEKPQNLLFEDVASGICKNTLEELEQTLTGTIQKGETKVITIHWYWPYENKRQDDLQDTKDSKNIQSYQFEIRAYGEKWERKG